MNEYHTDLFLTAYGSNCREAVTRGGYYDGLGVYSGRNRLVTGFGSDMRMFIGRLSTIERPPSVAATHKDVEEAKEAAGRLRTQGQCIVTDYNVGYNGL